MSHGSVLATTRSLASVVKLSHSVFALPFALLSLLVTTGGRPSFRLLLSVIAAVVAARTAAMAYNRYADRDIDALNPRTMNRELPRGVVSPRAVLWLVLGASAAFLAICASLSATCFWLGIPTLAWLLFYSRMKRHSALVHLWLGVALGLSPVAAYVAAGGTLGAGLWAPLTLGSGVAVWVAGFDVLYACQDERFDRAHGLRSLPAALGAKRAMAISKGLHVLAVAAFVGFGLLAPLSWCWSLGVVLAAGLLVWQHSLLRPDDLSRMQTAFFTANGLIALLLLLAGGIDLWWLC